MDVQILCNMLKPCGTQLFLLAFSFAYFIGFVPFVVSLQFFHFHWSCTTSRKHCLFLVLHYFIKAFILHHVLICKLGFRSTSRFCW